jgi:hypothetical protein
MEQRRLNVKQRSVICVSAVKKFILRNTDAHAEAVEPRPGAVKPFPEEVQATQYRYPSRLILQP